MKKRLITAAISTAVAAASLSFSAFSSYAKYNYADNSSTVFFEYLKENYMEVDFSMFRCSLTEGTFRDYHHDSLYFGRTDSGRYAMIGLINQPDILFVGCNEGFDSEDAEMLVQEYNELNGSADLKFDTGELSDGVLVNFQIKSESGKITSVEAKDICNFLKEKGIARQCRYLNEINLVTESFVYTPYLPYYFYLDDEEKLALKNYLKDNNYDWHVENEDGTNGIYVAPDKNVTLEEQIEMVNRIYDDLGFGIDWIMLMSTGKVADNVDVLNSVEGDANTDGELTLADAVAIMQSVGNPDEYALDVQQKFNADFSGNGDGVTNKDALAIQKKLLKLE